MTFVSKITAAAFLFCTLSSVVACGGQAHPFDDRSRVYWAFGAPDSKEVVTIPKPRLPEEGEGDAYPFEIWHCDHLGSKDAADLELVDYCLCGNYTLVLPQNCRIKDALELADDN